MHSPFIKPLAALALATTLAAPAHALDLVNSLPPASGTSVNVISSNDWLAEQFAVSGPVVINSISAFVTSTDSGNDAGKTFTVALYSDNGANLPALNWFDTNQGQVAQATVTYSADGWNGVSGLNWSVGAGHYWLAIEQHGSGNEAGSLLAPTSATPAALAVAFYSGGTGYQATGLSDSFGLRITATPAVPEPESLALLLAGLGVVAMLGKGARRP